MVFDRKKYLEIFVEETRERLKKLNKELLLLEKEPDNSETLKDIFGLIHTIKGSSNMMNLKAITKVAHTLEDALDALRKKKIRFSKELSNLFFKGIDIISEMVEEAYTAKDITLDTSNICEELGKVAEGKLEDKETLNIENKGLADIEKNIAPEAISPVKKKGDAKPTGPMISQTIRVDAVNLDQTIKLLGELISTHNRLKQRLFDIKEIEQLSKAHRDRLSFIFCEGEFSSENGNKGEVIKTSRSLYLKLKQLLSSIRDDVTLQELLTGELQKKALKMRMLPLAMIFDTFSRPVRDMSISLGKNIGLIIEGEDTELDKKIIEKISDPLIHMLRNSIDHGVEKPEDRIKAGKSEKGIVKISAGYEGGNVLIEVSDDGAGIPLNKIKEKALQRKIFDKEKLKKMPESEIIDLIFHSGLSTSAIITDVSGRGVGMDIVRKNVVEQLKGSIQIETKEGKGTTFLLRLPLTMATMRVLQFTVMDLTFAIPINSTFKTIRIAKTEIINVVDRRAVRLDEQIVPVISLDTLLSIPQKKQSDKRDDLLLIMVFMGGEKLGLIVDSLLEEVDVVVKPLPAHMKNIQWVSGVTISGNNEIVNILHVPRIIQAAKRMKDEKHLERMIREDKKTINILIVEDSISTREIEKSILESYGYKVDVAGDGVEALEKTKDIKYDLIVTDIEMPRMDGFSLTEKLRKDSEYKHVPIVIVTSREKEEDKKRGIRVGADAYIVKGSFDRSNLLDTIQNLVGN